MSGIRFGGKTLRAATSKFQISFRPTEWADTSSAPKEPTRYLSHPLLVILHNYCFSLWCDGNDRAVVLCCVAATPRARARPSRVRYRCSSSSSLKRSAKTSAPTSALRNLKGSDKVGMPSRFPLPHATASALLKFLPFRLPRLPLSPPLTLSTS